MVLDLEGFDVDATLVFLLDHLSQLFDQHVCDVVDVPTALGGGDTVHEGALLETRLRNTASHLPPFVDFLVVDLDRVADLIIVTL